MPFVYSLAGRPVTLTPLGLIEITPPWDVDANGLLELPVGYELDADGLIVLDFSWDTPPFVQPVPWRVDLCVGWERVATCIAHHFTGTQRRNQAGSFVLEASPVGATSGGVFDSELNEYVSFDPRDIDTIRLVGGNRILFGGYVKGDNGGFYVERDDQGERWRWTGEDAWWLLRGRLAFPNPAVASGWAVSHDVRTGIASTILTQYLNDNMGASALAARQVPMFQVDDEVIGASLSFSARLQTLEELAQRLAAAGGFEVLPDIGFDGTVTILLSAARDLSGIVVFSDKGDLLSSRARFQQREATYTLSAGTGEGTARLFRTADTGATGASRREQLSDVSSLEEAGEVQADADTHNALAAERFAITSELTAALANIAIGFGLRLGDKLGISIDGRRYVLPIEAVTFDVGPGSQLMTPQFGDAIPDELTALLRKVDTPSNANGVA